jgi:hypothetical protein
MNGCMLWRRLLGGILDGVMMSLFVAFAAGLTWVLGT